ncbi:NAD(P)/FAD-dependent oxidoreductase [Halomicrococcus gelatinilyticus]|uniref:NAD(P)/FAD-dependent oxidoreductase n=1 Tax=Halomicrococcus gelatinilyticus TaxID=1702103 RepID=UPI002E10DDF4
MTVVSLATVPRYDSTRASESDGQAVVVGAGMAGLLAARVLADGFDEVTVVDRDPLPDDPVARRGVPQSRHVHVMLTAAQSTLDDLLTGYGEELLAADGLLVDAARDVNFFIEGDYLADGPRRIPQYCATRRLYEWIARRLVADIDGVELRPSCLFTEYLADDAATVVDGVEIRNDAGDVEKLTADLVVDATGRTSRTPTWLETHDYAPPPVDEVFIDLAYSTTLVERPADDRRSFVVTPSSSCPRGAGMLPVEGGRWLVTLFGVHGEYPPADPAGFVEFAATLPVPDPHRLLDEHRWTAADVVHYRFPTNVRRRYEDLDRFPEGLVVVGDAIASFNPIYAQGMSVAALESLLLYDVLASGGRDDAGRRFFDRSEAVVDAAWNMAVGSDFQFPRTAGPRPRGTALTGRYLARLARRAHADGVLRDAFFRVMMMEEHPVTLFRPGVAWRVLGPAGGALTPS